MDACASVWPRVVVTVVERRGVGAVFIESGRCGVLKDVGRSGMGALVVRLWLLRAAFAADREGRAVHRRLAQERAENGSAGMDVGDTPVG